MSSTQSKQPKRHPKSIAREHIVQALYQHALSPKPVSVLIEEMQQAQPMPKPVLRVFKKYMHGIIEHEATINETIAPHVRDIKDVHILSLAILQCAVYELLYCFEVPYKAVINEAIELAKSFGIEDARQFVNAVLDKIAPTIRTMEVGKA